MQAIGKHNPLNSSIATVYVINLAYNATNYTSCNTANSIIIISLLLKDTASLTNMHI